MGRLKRYDLYEDGEEIPSALPGKQPLGREEELRERDARRRNAENREQRRRYFAANEADDGLGAPSPLFDDFDRFGGSDLEEEIPRKPKKRSGGWIAVTVICLLLLLAMGVAALPQLTGIRYRFLPNLAIVNGSLISLDPAKMQWFEECRAELLTDQIYQGIYIDNIHVGGMTRGQALQAVEALHETPEQSFDITVTVGNESWHVNPERVPVSRNAEEVVEKAWAVARENTGSLRGSGLTPFQERVNEVSRLRSYPQTFATVQDYDRKALRTLTDGIVNYVNRDPVNSTVASFDFNTKAFTFTEDRPGAKLDPDQLYTQVATLLDDGVTTRELRVVPEKILAEITKTELQNRFGLISAYTTSTTNNKNRNTNIQLSAAAINGVTVLPGETFSFNKATGERTAEKGYKEAAAISGGATRDEIGGGVCQTSSTLFNAVVRADLEIVERHGHAWPSSYIEKGFDATVNWPGLDFQFKNNTNWPVFILANYANRKVTVNIYGMSLGADVRIDLESEVTRVLPQPEGTNYVLNSSLAPGESKKTVTGRQGYMVDTWKIWYQGSRETKREKLFTTTYKAYQETVEYNPR